MGHTLEGEQTKKGGGDKASLFHLVYSLKNYKPLVSPPPSSSQAAEGELSWGEALCGERQGRVIKGEILDTLK